MEKRLNRNIKLLGLLNLFMDLKFYCAIVAIYFVKVTGSMTLGMSIFSITMISSALFELPTGVISDRLGRKKTVILGTIASLSYSIMFAVAGDYKLLVIGAILEGIEIAFFSGNNEALLYDLLKQNGKQDEYATYLGKVNSMYQVACGLGAVVGGVVAYIFSYRLIMYLTIIPKIINIFIGLKIDEPAITTKKVNVNPYAHLKQTIKQTLKNKTLTKQMIADGLSGGIGEATYQFRSVFYELVWPTWALGIPCVLSNIGSFFASWFGGKIIKKFNNKNIIIWGNIYSALSNILAVLTKNIISPFILVSNSLIPTDIAKGKIAQRLYTDEYRASMGSLKSLVISITYAVSAILVGVIADKYGVVFTILISQVVKISTILIYLNIFKNNKELIH